MPSLDVPFGTVRAPGAMVASADGLATQAGLAVLSRGGNAVDAAIASNAALAVTAPHLCGMGGDLFVLVHSGGSVFALDASGAAGEGADAEAMRREGHHGMPFRHDPRSVTVPGCVDGWMMLHERFGRLPITDLLAPALSLAVRGFPASPLLVGSLSSVDHRARQALHELVEQADRPGRRVRRPGVARTLRAIGEGGRAGLYDGEFGRGLIELGGGTFTSADLARTHARWVEPLRSSAFGQHLWTVPPPSQGYLALGGAALVSDMDLPDDPDDPTWAHLLIEAAVAAGHDRPSVLHEAADGTELLAAIARRASSIRRDTASGRPLAGGSGDTTYLCAVDDERMCVSLIQSNASGFGSWLVEPHTGINLHNRGLGFNLEPGHPAEVAPGRRPPHTLSPALATHLDGSPSAVLGTMGGDGQPQILLQLLTRLLHHGHSPARAIAAGRWVLGGPSTGFDTWTGGPPVVHVEGNAPDAWDAGLTSRGQVVERASAFDSAFGHAHAIVIDDDNMLNGAADPRARIGSCAGS